VSRPPLFPVFLTQRALSDLQEIWDYSEERWGTQTAKSYLHKIEAGLDRLKENPGLLRPEPDFHASLMFYRIERHFLVCDVQSSFLIVLTVFHASMDLPSRLAELQPTLLAEVEILHRKVSRTQPEQP